jgi:hypothetical protein
MSKDAAAVAAQVWIATTYVLEDGFLDITAAVIGVLFLLLYLFLLFAED